MAKQRNKLFDTLITIGGATPSDNIVWYVAQSIFYSMAAFMIYAFCIVYLYTMSVFCYSFIKFVVFGYVEDTVMYDSAKTASQAITIMVLMVVSRILYKKFKSRKNS